MSDEAALLAAIRTHSDEDTPRLAYADWLDEHNRPERAEFIRAQIAIARLPDDDPRRCELEIAERRLLAKNCVEWSAPWGPFQNWEYAGDGPWRALFRRGFLEAVDGFPIPGANQTPGYDALFAAHPIRETAHIGPTLTDLSAALSWSGWERIESLSVGLWYTGREAASHLREQFHQADQFLRHANLPRLRRLSLSLPGVNERDILHWFQLPVVRQSTALSISTWNPNAPSAGMATVMELANGDFPNLRELHLTTSNHPDCVRALRRFIASDTWKQITRFSIAGEFPWLEALAAARLEQVTLHAGGVSEFANALLSAPATLEEFNVRGGGNVFGESLSRILAAEATANLRRLSFSQAALTDDDIARIAKSPALAHLNRLTITHNHPASAGFETLYASENLQQLTHLSVSGQVTEDAVRALAHNESARQLRELSFGWFREPSVLTALASGGVFPNLHTVGFGCMRPSPDRATIEAFVNSPKLPRLCVVPFSIDDNRVPEVTPAFRECAKIAWAGGEMADGGDGVRVAVLPEDVYLPNHLDGLSGQPW